MADLVEKRDPDLGFQFLVTSVRQPEDGAAKDMNG
jgi:hypothetical protein